MKLKEVESGFSIIAEEEFSLSGKALAELIQATLAKGAGFRLKVKGFSMFPFIRDGDVITISNLPDSSMNFGRISAFFDSQTGKLVMHRIVGKNNGGYLIKGDNTFKADRLICKENILGYVNRIERNNKAVFLSLGWERLLIAFFSKTRVLYLVTRLSRLLPLSIRNALKSII